MSAEILHRRADVLQSVIEAAEQRRDGVLPLDVPGVEAVFVEALLLRWHARLSAQLEGALFDQPDDLEAAVIRGWCATCDQLAGVRQVIDRLTAERLSPAMARKLAATAHKDWTMMALMAGLGGFQDDAAIAVGLRLEN